MAAELAATRPCPELARAHSSAPGAHPKLAPTRPPPSLTHIKHALGGGYRCKRGGQRVARSTSPETLVGFAAARIPPHYYMTLRAVKLCCYHESFAA
jgi:hypothetical protein